MNMKKMLTGLIAIGLILCQIQTVFGLETKSLQLISNSTNESLSNTTVTVLDVESSNSYYLNTDDEGYVIDDNQVLSTLDNKVLVLSAIYDSNVYNLCVDSLEDNQLYLEKDYEIENNSKARVTSGDWVTNSTTHVGTVWIPLDKAPGYGGLSMKTEYNSEVGYSLSGGSFLTCTFSSLKGTGFEPDYKHIPESSGKKNYVLYGEVNKYKLSQSQVGTGAMRVRYIVTNSVIDVEHVLETGTFSTTTSSSDTKLLKDSTTIVKKYLSSTYTISGVVTHENGLTCTISATGSKQNIRYYKQYSNKYYYRIGFNSLVRKTSEF